MSKPPKKPPRPPPLPIRVWHKDPVVRPPAKHRRPRSLITIVFRQGAPK